MSSKTKTQIFKDNMENQKREKIAENLHNKALAYIDVINHNTVMFTMIMREIFHKEYYKELFGGGTFDQYCASICSQKSATIRKYIKILDYHIEEKKIDIKLLLPHPINKLEVLTNAKDPKKWLSVAADYPLSDFRKEVLHKEKGIEPNEDAVKKYIKKKEEEKDQSVCAFWKKGHCTEGVC